MTMGIQLGFDLDLLRTFVAIAEERSFTRAAARVGRTQSAVSLQMQRLEGLLGQTVIVRGKGGSVELNGEGAYLLGRARELLELNDDIMRSMRAAPVHGIVRMGFPAELSARFLSRILDRFSHAAPAVEIEVEVAASCFMAVRLKNSELDLVVLREGLEPRQWPAVEVWRSSMKWITSEKHQQHLRDPMPLANSPAHCVWSPFENQECQWHMMAIRALEQEGRRYRIVSTSTTVQALLAAAQAGLAVTHTLADDSLLEGLRPVRDDEGLPRLPECRYLMLKAREPRQPATDILAAQLRDIFSENAAQTG
jgi:DNA-binding transcriptional LysR family regulator